MRALRGPGSNHGADQLRSDFKINDDDNWSYIFRGALAENGRLNKLSSLFNAYGKIMGAHRGEVICSVTTAKVGKFSMFYQEFHFDVVIHLVCFMFFCERIAKLNPADGKRNYLEQQIQTVCQFSLITTGVEVVH